MRKNKVLSVVVALIVLSASGIGLGYWWYKHVTKSKVYNTPVVITPSSPPKNKDSAILPGYEIIQQKQKTSSPRITVFVDTTDQAKIKKLDDKLYDQYKNSHEGSWAIDYFDNRSVAAQYFDKITDPKVTAVDKKLLVKHYIALAIISKNDHHLVFPNDQKSIIQLQKSGKH